MLTPDRSRTSARLILAATLTAVALTACALRSSAEESALGGNRAPWGAGVAQEWADAGQAGSPVSVGDRLKITFFESLDVATRAPGGERESGLPASVLHTFYQRMDLSGEYTIDQDGSVSLPRLGRFMLDGRGIQDVQSELAVAFSRVMGRPADINVAILERSPVYVVGPVKQPGAYKFVPGMMVLQAIALAGGLDKGLGGASQVIEGVREIERIRKAADQMKRLLARRAKLDAEHAGQLSPQPSEQLIALAGRDGANIYVEMENGRLRAERGQKLQKMSEANLAIQLARNEIPAIKKKLAQLDLQRDIRADRLDDLQKLFSRGLTTRTVVINLRSELADVEARRQDLLHAVVQAEGRLALAEQAKARLTASNAAEVQLALAVTDGEIMELQQTLASTEMLTSVLANLTAELQLVTASTTMTYQIVRQGRSGPTVLAAQETSALRPGDVLKVKLTTTRQPRDNAIGVGQQTSLQKGHQTLR